MAKRKRKTTEAGPGRPTFGREPLDTHIRVRVTAEQRKQLDAAAKQARTSVTEIVRAALDRYFKARRK